MRLTRFVFFMGIVLLMIGQSLFAQSKEERKEKMERQVAEKIESGRLKILVDRAVPMAGRSVNLTSTYLLRIEGDSVIASLPYFGRAYSAPYGGSGGVNFSEVVADKEIEPMKKGGTAIKFRVKTQDDNYTFHVNVYTNGSSSIHVSPVNKQAITYYGDVDLESK